MEFNATFLVAMVSFGLFIIIMNQIYYKPIIKVINERKDFIDEHNLAAQNSKDKADSILQDKEIRLQKNAAKAKETVISHVSRAENDARILTEEAKRNYVTEISLAKSGLAEKERQVQEELRNNTEELALTISAKIMGDM